MEKPKVKTIRLDEETAELLTKLARQYNEGNESLTVRQIIREKAVRVYKGQSNDNSAR